jgi:hypothetical protein
MGISTHLPSDFYKSSPKYLPHVGMLHKPIWICHEYIATISFPELYGNNHLLRAVVVVVAMEGGEGGLGFGPGQPEGGQRQQPTVEGLHIRGHGSVVEIQYPV